MSDALRTALAHLVDHEEVDADATAAAVDVIMRGAASPALVGAFLGAMGARGVTVGQVVGAARTMRAHADAVSTGRSPLVDNCGTGGDGGSTFSISTGAALVCAGAGAAMAKHGNRAASGKFGGADALEALGVNIEVSADVMGRCLDEVGMAFLFARRLHPAMRYVAPVRSELGIRTIFNLLGPLTNPAGVRRQVIGVAAPEALRLIAGALAELGCDHALVIHGRDGLDEVSLEAPVDVIEVRDGAVAEFVIDAEAFGLDAAPRGAARVDTLDDSVRVLREILDGQAGPRADIVLANAGLTLYVEGRAPTFAEGTRIAREAVESGAARDLLRRLVAFTSAPQGGSGNATD
ncbi:MAG: anthranilate phosphoribosyltransferase [Candidatus Binatia bacterium]|nr:anthranilate phosphoribosyltransferase [Candidatus Binatia bacterium]